MTVTLANAVSAPAVRSRIQLVAKLRRHAAGEAISDIDLQQAANELDDLGSLLIGHERYFSTHPDKESTLAYIRRAAAMLDCAVQLCGNAGLSIRVDYLEEQCDYLAKRIEDGVWGTDGQ